MTDSKKALISGSFDPPTLGHLDIVRRAAKIFDEVWVVAFVNSAKKGRYTDEERIAMLHAAFDGIKGVHVDLSCGLLADYAEAHGLGTIVRGARSASDFDYELSLSGINSAISPELDTVIIPANPKYSYISSTMVGELVKYGRDFTQFVPEGVAELMNCYKNA